jgi:type I restriction enzyme R subunit
MIIDRLTRHGAIDPAQLYEPPFTAVHHQGVEGAFGDGDVHALFAIVEEINQRAA